MGVKVHDCTCGAFNDARLDKVKMAEPIFVLRAQDLTADIIVREWYNRVVLETRKGRPNFDVPGELRKKLSEAWACADAMQAWPTRKLPGQKFESS